MAEVKLENVTKRYGDKTVIEDFSLSIRDGECFTLLGPSACGKTTVVRAICGFEKLENGEISIGDKVVFSKGKKIFIPPEERNIGVLFQDYAVWPHMTVYENVHYPLKKRKILTKTECHSQTETAISNVKLGVLSKRLPYQLSGGQQQRVALARALVSSDRFICLDEPLSNLDANLREEMCFEIKELQRETGVTVLYVTHDQEAALAISDRMAVLDKSGRIRQLGAPEDIYKNPADSFVFKFMGLSNFISLEAKGNELFIEKDASGVIGSGAAFPYPPPHDIKANRLFAACRPRDIELTHDGKLKGKVSRVIFLGSIYEYRVLLGKDELRIQEDSYKVFQKGLFKEGDICGIEFKNLRYYEQVEVM
ncbi:MAG: ABC transporter ATP-binding protein, partial [Pseudomonadota bacterium]